MRFILSLSANQRKTEITLNYQYPLSAAIYKIIQRADASFSNFLHNTGYGEGKNFKLFTFSDIDTPFIISGDRMQLQTERALLTVCFHMPQAAEKFIQGLFIHQQLEIADNKSKGVFKVDQVVAQAPLFYNRKEAVPFMLQPLSPIVTGRKNDRGYYNYFSPTDEGFVDCLRHNLIEKYRAVYAFIDDAEPLQEDINIEVILFRHPPKARLLTIKKGSIEETRIKGYTKFRLRIIAPIKVLELAMNSGLGLYNSMGCGCVRESKN